MDTAHFKDKLEAERDLLENQLGDIAARDPATGEWAPKDPGMDTMPAAAEPGEAGDRQEEMEERQDEAATLSARYAEVAHALEKIKNGTYGLCEDGGDHEIEMERLEANPAARTCERHM